MHGIVAHIVTSIVTLHVAVYVITGVVAFHSVVVPIVVVALDVVAIAVPVVIVVAVAVVVAIAVVIGPIAIVIAAIRPVSTFIPTVAAASDDQRDCGQDAQASKFGHGVHIHNSFWADHLQNASDVDPAPAEAMCEDCPTYAKKAAEAEACAPSQPVRFELVQAWARTG
jgi:hypothetical protein